MRQLIPLCPSPTLSSNCSTVIYWRIRFYFPCLTFQISDINLHVWVYSYLNEMITAQGDCVALEIHASLKGFYSNLTFFSPPLGGVVLLDWTASLFGSRNHLAEHSGRADEERRGLAWEGRCHQRSPGGGNFFLLPWRQMNIKTPYTANACASSGVFSVTCVVFRCLKYLFSDVYLDYRWPTNLASWDG